MTGADWPFHDGPGSGYRPLEAGESALSDESPPLPKWPMLVMRAGDRRSVSRSATRALDVLEYFGQVRRPLRAIEIARHLSLPPSTVNQLLKTMVESAHLAFDASTKTYLPSPRLTRFSGWMIDTYGSDERLRSIIAEIHASTGAVVTLSTPNDLFMQVIDVAGVDFPTEGYDSAERGLHVSMFGSVIGMAHLSTQPVTEVRRLADRARIAVADHDDLLSLLAGIRIDGFADGPSADGVVWSVAMPLPAKCSGMPLVLGLAGPVARVKANRRAISGSLRSAIERLSSLPQPAAD
jgi:DNA-binding IclR family transcriptional regulator